MLLPAPLAHARVALSADAAAGDADARRDPSGVAAALPLEILLSSAHGSLPNRCK
jgi:hypothetical protein